MKMPVSLEFFNTSHLYADAADGIIVPITLCVGRQSVELLAKLDTGAPHIASSIRRYAEILGLDVESSHLQAAVLPIYYVALHPLENSHFDCSGQNA